MSQESQSPDPETPYERDSKLIEDAVKLLSEHFDSVTVFCTRYENVAEGTNQWVSGHGNAWAREGLVRDWLIKQEEFTRETARQAYKEEE